MKSANVTVAAQNRNSMKHIFIVNPISGRGGSKKYIPVIEEYCKENDLEFEIRFSEFPKHSMEIAAEYKKSDDVCLYAVGGDGTANEVLNGLNDGVQMAVLPAGSGNDFVFGTLVPDCKDVNQLIRDTISGVNMKVDYGLANDFKFINILSLGYCSIVNYLGNFKYRHIRIIPTKLMYFYAAIVNIFKPTPVKVRYIIDDKEYNGVAIIFAISNGCRYGGMFKAAPDANITDGIFDVWRIDFVKGFVILNLIPKYMDGSYRNLDITTSYKGSKITIYTEEKMRYQVDGEVRETDEMHVEIQKNALNLRVPLEVKERMEK